MPVSDRSWQKYLPSAKAARKRLLDKMNELEADLEAETPPQLEAGEKRRWWQIYSYSYNESLTGCATQLEEIERYARLIVGEQR